MRKQQDAVAVLSVERNLVADLFKFAILIEPHFVWIDGYRHGSGGSQVDLAK